MAACHFPGIAFGEVRVWQLTLSCLQACFYAARKQAFSMDHFITGGLPTWETSSCQDWQTFSCVTNPYSNGDWRTWSISWKQFICLVCQTQEQAPRFKFDKRLCFFDMWKKNKKEKERNKKVNGIFDRASWRLKVLRTSRPTQCLTAEESEVQRWHELANLRSRSDI